MNISLSTKKVNENRSLKPLSKRYNIISKCKKKKFFTYQIYEYELRTYYLTKQQFTMYPITTLNKIYLINTQNN